MKHLSALAVIIFSAFASIAQTPMFFKGGGTGTSTNPLNVSSQKLQLLYTPSDLSATSSGKITKIYMRNTTANASGTYNNFKLSFTQTNATSFANNTFLTNLSVARYDASVTFTANSTAGGWFEIPLTTLYEYDNTKSLIVEIEYTSKTNGITTHTSNSGVDKRIGTTDYTSATGTLSLTQWNDMGIDVDPSTPCSVPVPGSIVNISPATLICPGEVVKLYAAGSTTGSGDVKYKWQSSPSPGGPFTDVTGEVSYNSYNAAPTVTTYYRFGISCNGGAYQFNATPFVVKVRTPLVGTYTISSAPTDVPDGGTNFNSFADLQGYFNCGSIAGKVTINVSNGTYTDQLTIGAMIGASVNDNITINGNGSTLKFDAVTGARHIIKLNGAKHVTIKDLTLKSTATTYGWGVHLMGGADSNRITHCTIDMSSVTSTTSGNTAGIVMSSSTSGVTGTGNNANAVSIDSNTIIGGYHGIVLYGNTNGTGCYLNKIYDNTIKDFYATGIEAGNADSLLISYNDISRNNRSNTTTFTGIQFNSGCKRSNIISNKIHDTHPSGSLTGSSHGIYFNNCDATAGAENKVYNNLLYNFNGSTGLIYALYNSGSDGVKYYHNSIALNNSASTSGVATRGFFQTTVATGIEFKNNNILITRGGTGPKAAIYIETAGSDIVSNYNNLYVNASGTSNFVGYNLTQGYATIAAWKTNTTYDANSKSLDPSFSNTPGGDLKPTENALNNAGVFVGITTDFAGITRNATTPDIGAFEFDAGPCTNPPSTGGNAIISVSPSSICSGSNVTLDLANIVPGLGQTYTWQSSATSGAGFSDINTPSANTEIIVNPASTTYYRAVLTCGTGSATSAEVQVVVKAPLQGNTYTIDQSGSGPLNFTSFGNAVSAIGCGVTSATVFNVAGQTFTEQVILNDIPGMSATNTITFNGVSGSILSYNSASSAERATLKLNGTKYITINNIRIDATGRLNTEYGFGVQLLNNADNNTISNCEINITSDPVTASSTQFAGIVISGAPASSTAALSDCDNNVIANNTIKGGLYGITLFGGGTNATLIDNNKITGNNISDFYSYGIYLGGTKNTIVEQNDISRTHRTNIGAFRGIYITGSNLSGSISKNKIHDPFGAALSSTNNGTGIYAEAVGETGKENTISNNLIYNFYSTGPQIGINDNGSSYIKYYHNTISLDDVASASSATQYATWGIIFGSSSTVSAEFKNNIVTITRGGNYSKYAIYLISNTVGLISNNNVLYVNASGGASGVGYIASAASVSLANWQTNSGGDLNSKAINPGYVNLATGDLTPSEPQINNIGANVGIITDINGVARNTTPDPGAIEFGNNLCNVPPTAGTVNLSITAEVCAGTPLTLNLNGQDIGAGISYQWESASTLAGTYSAESGLLSNPLYAFNAPATSRFYRAAVTCSGVTSYSNVVQVSVAPLRSGNFTIDAGTPTGGTNFQTFADAINYIKCGIDGNVVFNVEPGTTYNEQVVIPAITGTATYTITINGNGASIVANPSSSSRAGLILDGTDHVIIDSLNVNVSSGSYGWGILLTNQADNNIIRRCEIKTKKNFTDGSSAIGFIGIAINGSFTSVSTVGNNGNNNLIENNFVEGGYYGILVYGGGNGSPNVNNVIRNNTVQDAFTAPIFMIFQSNGVISGNDLSWVSQGAYQTSTYGIYLFTGNDGILVEKNKIHGINEPSPTGSRIFYAIYTSSSVASAGHENKIINNLVYDINHRGTVYGIYNTGSSYCNIYHNTIVLEGSSTSGSATYGFYQTNTASNINFKNNLVYILRSSSGDKYGIYKNTAANNIASDNNILFVNSGSGDYIGFQATARQTLADWQATGNDAASVSTDPMFIDPTNVDFRPSESSVDNKGTPLGILTDIAGVSRSPIKPDAGAFEFGTIFPVTLFSFKGEEAGEVNNLYWITATETNNREFVIERSVDGKNFSTLGSVLSKAQNGNSATALSYNFVDSKPVAGTNFYRLKQVDKDGKTSYSIMVVVGRKVQKLLVSSVFPNPAKNELNLVISSPQQEKINIVITDLSGKILMQHASIAKVGNTVAKINVQSLAQGSYLVKVTCSNGCETAVNKFIKY